MTTAVAQPRSNRKSAPGAKAIFLARLVLFWERFWPAVLPSLIVPFAFVFVSLFDLWRLTPVWSHWLLLTLGAAAFVWRLYKDLRGFRFPTRRDAQARLEQDGGVAHAAVQALDDTPFEASRDASPLWRAHQQDMAERARAARLKGARPTADARDPWGLRHIALGLLAIAFIAGGDKSLERLALGLDPGAHAGGGVIIADMWIEPPAYSGRAPIYLLRAGEEPPDDAQQINAPEGSVLVAQVNGAGRARLNYQMTDDRIQGEFVRNGESGRAEINISESGLLRLTLGRKEGRWPIGVVGDAAPSVAFLEPPARTDDGRVDFTISLEDDYGVTSARLVMRLDPEQERPLDAPDFDAGSLDQARTLPLEGIAGQSGERAATLDLQADPWAGLQVLAKVVVVDGAGQEGDTGEVSLTLPERMFFNPIAKAVIEQRQTLAVAAQDWRRSARSFDAMTLAPDIFYAEKPTNYLLLRAAFWRVMRQNGDSYDDAVEKFWPLALQLEDEALELARQRLEAAREALRQALERGASDEEINQRVEELRQAMNDYLAALAQSGQPTEEAPSRNAQQMDQSELDEMLDAIRNLSQQGANNAARQMLSDLESILDNLRLSQGSGQGQQGQGGGQAGRMADQAGELIGRQRELADETFERGQAGDGNGDDLATREGELGGDLDELLDSLEDSGAVDPEGEAGRALGRARSAMREAEGALAGDDFDAAGDAMERAIANLRDGAEALAREQMRQAQGNGADGEQDQPGRATDPLGRTTGQAAGDGVEVPGEGEAGRTRAIIDELRRRLGEPGREDDEVDYLERLLERF